MKLPSRSELAAAFKSGAWVSQFTAVLTPAVLFGVIDTTQATALGNAAAALSAAGTSVTAVVHTFHVVQLNRAQATK